MTCYFYIPLATGMFKCAGVATAKHPDAFEVIGYRGDQITYEQMLLIALERIANWPVNPNSEFDVPDIMVQVEAMQDLARAVLSCHVLAD